MNNDNDWDKSRELIQGALLFGWAFYGVILLYSVGEKGIGASTGKPLHFKGSIFHRIIKGFMAQVCSLRMEAYQILLICLF